MEKSDKIIGSLIIFCVMMALLFLGMSAFYPDPSPDTQQNTFTQCVLSDPWYFPGELYCIHYRPCPISLEDYSKVTISIPGDMEIYIAYGSRTTGIGNYASRTFYMKEGTHQINSYGNRGLAANITLNVTGGETNQIHITKDQGVWVHPDGTEEIFYEVPVFNGTITDKWTVVLDGQQNHRFEINNNTIVQTDEYWYHNMDIGESWEYKEYKIVYVEVGS